MIPDISHHGIVINPVAIEASKIKSLLSDERKPSGES